MLVRPGQASQSEASLARSSVTADVKRRQRGGGPGDGAPKSGLVAGADTVRFVEGETVVVVWPDDGGPVGV